MTEYAVIRISRENYLRLLRVASELQATAESKVSLNDALTYVLTSFPPS